MANRNPEMEYGEAPDMTVYQRKEGDRILIYVQKGWIDENIVYNVLEQRHKNKYIDYLVIYDPNEFVQRISQKLNLSFIDYEENDFELLLRNIHLVTRAILFYKVDNGQIARLVDALEIYNIPLSFLR